MNTTEQTLTKFYTAFAALDADTMASCYAEEATFDDPAFSLRGRDQVAGMWRMLCASTQAKGREAWRLDFRDLQAGADTGRVHWEAHYRFSSTGRLVHNIIDAEFTFTPDGLIASHKDTFNFWRWSVQALGIPGFVLGWTPWFNRQMRKQISLKLAQFMADTP